MSHNKTHITKNGYTGCKRDMEKESCISVSSCVYSAWMPYFEPRRMRTGEDGMARPSLTQTGRAAFLFLSELYKIITNCLIDLSAVELARGESARPLAAHRFCNFLQNFVTCWRARSRLYQNKIVQENMRLTAFFKIYKICILLHLCNLKIFAKNWF